VKREKRRIKKETVMTRISLRGTGRKSRMRMAMLSQLTTTRRSKWNLKTWMTLFWKKLTSSRLRKLQRCSSRTLSRS